MSALVSLPIVPWLFSYLLNALWQVPLIFFAAWLAARMLRGANPRTEHRLWVGALLLQVALPACHLRIANIWHALLALLPAGGAAAQEGEVRVILGPATSGAGTLHLPTVLVGFVVCAYACALIYFAGRLAWGLWRTHAIARSAAPVTLPAPAALRWVESVRCLSIAPPPRIAASPHMNGPVTVGLWRGIVLVPSTFLERVSDGDLDAVLVHELAHVSRRDFAKNLLYSLAALPVLWHPLLWRTRARLAESRELVCDAMAAGAVAGQRQYARSLLRLAALLSERTSPSPLHAIGILDANTDANIFERRVMNLTHKPASLGAARRLVVTAACAVLAIATCASALALRMNVGAPAAIAKGEHPSKLSVKSDIMAGNRISGQNPEYPPHAKATRIQGTVVLAATISKDGTIKDLKVQKTPDKLLATSALVAVRTWRYRPYLLNGEPIDVETTINVTYSLAG